jgi:hypothetical protein
MARWLDDVADHSLDMESEWHRYIETDHFTTSRTHLGLPYIGRVLYIAFDNFRGG